VNAFRLSFRFRLRLPAAAATTAAAILLGAPLVLGGPPTDEPLHAAVQKSLTYLADGGRDWMEGRSCASCHHAPMMIWSLQHAKQRGFEIDGATLREVTAWTLDPKVNLMPKPPAKKEEKAPDAAAPNQPIAQKDADAIAAREVAEAASEANVAPVVAYYKLATDHAESSPAPPEMRAKMIQHFLEKQEADGGWNSYVAHPPMLDSGETSTLYVLLALLGKDGKAEPATTPDWASRKARALAYLAKAKPSDELQPKLWRLLLRKYLATSEPAASLGGSREADLSAVLSQQHGDGGWGQHAALPSDAYATGQALYFLEAAGCEIPAEARDKAVAFLVQTQKADGSWPMTSRNRSAPKAGPGAKNLDIIGYAGTAWAAMGLASAAGSAK
jgi:hypothetical protein